MAIYKESIIDIELESGRIARSFTNQTIGEGDINADRFGFRCFRNGEQVPLTGMTITGQFTRADGNTVIIDGGAVNGDTAYITLPEACYAVEGQFTLSIKLSSGGITGTIRIVDGTVINTTNGAAIDPGGVIPDLSEYLEAVEAAEEAAETINGISITATEIKNGDYNIIITKS